MYCGLICFGFVFVYLSMFIQVCSIYLVQCLLMFLVFNFLSPQRYRKLWLVQKQLSVCFKTHPRTLLCPQVGCRVLGSPNLQTFSESATLYRLFQHIQWFCIVMHVEPSNLPTSHSLYDVKSRFNPRFTILPILQGPE